MKFRARFSVKVIGQATVLARAGINIRVMFATGIMVSFGIRDIFGIRVCMSEGFLHICITRYVIFVTIWFFVDQKI